MMRHLAGAVALAFAAGVTGCSSGSTEPTAAADTSTVTSTEASPTTFAAITVPLVEADPEPRTLDVDARPVAATDPVALAAQIERAERAVRDPATPTDELRHQGHTQQVAYAALASRPEWDADVRAALPSELHLALDANLAARRASRVLLPTEPATTLPAWRIVAPAPADELLAHYRDAEAATGIEWEYLAAINLAETRMGRIIGNSSAGARGPMQFLPSTWDEPGIGEGDIDDPADAIPAAARYLVRRGGLDDMASALYGYNNSDAYVEAIEQYARVLRDDPRAYHGFHQWQVYYATAEGAIWLQEGYAQGEPVPVLDYLAEHPEAGPPA